MKIEVLETYWLTREHGWTSVIRLVTWIGSYTSGPVMVGHDIIAQTHKTSYKTLSQSWPCVDDDLLRYNVYRSRSIRRNEMK